MNRGPLVHPREGGGRQEMWTDRPRRTKGQTEMNPLVVPDNTLLGSQVLEGLAQASCTFVDLPGPRAEKARVFWVTLEGPIGAGKTELFRILGPRLEEQFGRDRIFFIPEPIAEMERSGLFQEYQRDPKRWAFEFQTTFFDKRTDYFRKAYDVMIQALVTSSVPQDTDNGCKTAILLSERSIVSDTCFMRVQYQCGHCSDATLNRYLSLNAKWRELYRGIVPGLIVYCRAGSDEQGIVALCQKRIKERARPTEEDLVTPEYNTLVLQEHERLFGTPDHNFIAQGFGGQSAVSIPVLIVDTTANYRDDARIALKKSGELMERIMIGLSSSPSPIPVRAVVQTIRGSGGDIIVIDEATPEHMKQALDEMRRSLESPPLLDQHDEDDDMPPLVDFGVRDHARSFMPIGNAGRMT